MCIRDRRYTGRLQLTLTDTSDVPELTQLPPMLFISLVENAFKYGASSTQPSRIEIEVSSPEAGKLSMKIVNTLLTPGVSAPAEQVRPEKHGVGLKNLRRRLELLFPENHTLSYGVNKEGMYEVIITIPYESND